MRKYNKKIELSWIDGFLAGRVSGKLDEQDRIVALLKSWQADKGYYANFTLTELIDYAIRRPDEEN